MKSCENSLDEDTAFDASAGKVQSFFCVVEDVVPEAGLQIAFQFRNVDVRPGPATNQFLCIMVDEETVVEKESWSRIGPKPDMFLGEV